MLFLKARDFRLAYAHQAQELQKSALAWASTFHFCRRPSAMMALNSSNVGVTRIGLTTFLPFMLAAGETTIALSVAAISKMCLITCK